MERVKGIGGFFFTASDPHGLAAWYEEHRGVSPPPAPYDSDGWTQREGPTVCSPLSRPPRARARTSTGADGASTSGCVTLDAIVAQLRAVALHVTVDPEEYPNGRFAQVQDVEGNAIQMWEP